MTSDTTQINISRKRRQPVAEAGHRWDFQTVSMDWISAAVVEVCASKNCADWLDRWYCKCHADPSTGG